MSTLRTTWLDWPANEIRDSGPNPALSATALDMLDNAVITRRVSWVVKPDVLETHCCFDYIGFRYVVTRNGPITTVTKAALVNVDDDGEDEVEILASAPMTREAHLAEQKAKELAEFEALSAGRYASW